MSLVRTCDWCGEVITDAQAPQAIAAMGGGLRGDFHGDVADADGVTCWQHVIITVSAAAPAGQLPGG